MKFDIEKIKVSDIPEIIPTKGKFVSIKDTIRTLKGNESIKVKLKTKVEYYGCCTSVRNMFKDKVDIIRDIRNLTVYFKLNPYKEKK